MNKQDESEQLVEAVCAFSGIRSEYFQRHWTVERYVSQLPPDRLVKLLEFLLNP